MREPGLEDNVYLLRKALYGSPISGRRWHEELTGAITSLGYKRSTIDHCLFCRTKGGTTDLLVVYVDELLVVMRTGGEADAEAQLDELHKLYGLKKVGVASHMLGMGVHQSDDGTVIEQRPYLENVIEGSGFADAKPLSTPWDDHFKGNQEPLGPTAVTTFRRTLGQLMYLSNTTRPDITFTVGRLASALKEPTVGDRVRVKRLLKYLCGTRDVGVKYCRTDEALNINTYVDAVYGIDKKGRSTTGYVLHVTGGAVTWRSHLRPTVADSPNTAEYIGLHEAAVTSMGIFHLMTEMGHEVTSPTLHEDNDGCKRLAIAGMGQKKARHLEAKYHYVQELCARGQVRAERIGSQD